MVPEPKYKKESKHMIDYEKAASTAPSSGNVPFLEPDQDCKLLVVDSKDQDGTKGNRYIIKVRVLEAKATGKIEAPAVGADRCVILNLDPPKNKTGKDYGLENLMNYAYGLNGGPIQGENRGQKLQRLLGQREISLEEGQRYGKPAAAFIEAMAIGMVIGNRTVGGMTQGTPNNPSHPIVYHNWYAIQQTPEQVLSRKTALKTGQPIQWTPV